MTDGWRYRTPPSRPWHYFAWTAGDPGFGEASVLSRIATPHPAVIDGFSDLILEVFGPDVGRHARSAVRMQSLPFGIPVEIEAEVLLHRA